MNDLFGLPDEVRASVLSVFGSTGRDWLEALPTLADQLTRRWRLSVSGKAYGGGSHALVVPVTGTGGTRAVLKVPVVDVENRFEAAALRRYGGDGAVQLYEHDSKSGALLLEQAAPGSLLADDPNRGAAIETACALLRRLRRPPGAGHPFPRVWELLERWLADWPQLDEHPFPGDLLREALSLARELITPDGDGVLVNRDAHLGNVLAAEREPWLLIDPKPLVGEPAFDGGYLLLDVLGSAPTQVDAVQLARRIGEGLGVSARRVGAWALVRAVENAMWAIEDGDDPGRDIARARVMTALM